MEEIKAMHELNLEWGCITNLMDKISNLEEKIEGGWPELVDMVADAMTEEGMNKNPVTAFFNLYGFLWRLYYRIKENPVKQPFNRYSFDEKNNWFMITNYDYKVYSWAIQNGLGNGISGAYMTLPVESLTEKQTAHLKRRCK